MRIIVTRPEVEGVGLCKKLVSFGHTPVFLPLLKIEPRLNISIPPLNYQLICVTSANGVRVAETSNMLKALPVVAVGEQSLRAAQLAGFTNAQAHGGDVHGLCEFVIKNFNPKNGTVLYLSGAETSGDLAGQLSQANFHVQRIILYDAVPLSLAAEKAAILKADAVLLYSPRTAKLWWQQILHLNLTKECAHIRHICLSENVAAALPQTCKIQIAKRPTEQHILELLDCASKAD
jgi:uroporphyrinogen-III synthase